VETAFAERRKSRYLCAIEMIANGPKPITTTLVALRVVLVNVLAIRLCFIARRRGVRAAARRLLQTGSLRSSSSTLGDNVNGHTACVPSRVDHPLDGIIYFAHHMGSPSVLVSMRMRLLAHKM
jgi:hypothetical protein